MALDKEENKKVSEVVTANEQATVQEAIIPKEVVIEKEFIPVDEIKENRSFEDSKSKDSKNQIKSKLFGINLLSTAGLLTATGILIATSTGLINYNMNSSFDDFYYQDGKVLYSINFNSLDTKKDNTLSIRINEEKDELIEYKLIYDYDTFILDKNIKTIKKKNILEEEEIELTDDKPLSYYLNSLDDFESINYTYTAFDENNQPYYQNVTLRNKGLDGEINGYFTINMDRIKEELSYDGEYMHYYATLKGSVGMMDRTFDRMAIKVTSLISTFKALTGECHCTTRSADGTYHINLNYNDDYGYFDFKEIYMKDMNDNETEHLESIINWHDEIKIPVLKLSGSSEIHLVYIDKEENKRVELIFKDGSKDILVRYDMGEEEIFKTLDTEFDIKV
ncbi:hypothetical protein J6Y73_02295 [bacterium]|nr:hypothetical protein [bacterium]